MSQLNYQHLYYFYITAKEGSIVKASAILHLTPQTISEQIRVLEDYFGFELFDRISKRLKLNSQGQLAYSFARDIFTLGGELLQSVRNQNHHKLQVLSVGVTDVIPKVLAFDLFKTCFASNDEIRLVCKEGDLDSLSAELALNRLDMILSDRPLPKGSHVKAYNHLLGSSGLSFFMAEQHAKPYQATFPQSLHGQPFLIPGDKSAQKLNLLAWFARHKINPQIKAEFEDSALMKLFGQQGYGVFCASTSIEHHLQEQYNVRVIGRTDEIKERLYLISPEKQIKHPAVLALFDNAKLVIDS
ncbi:MAG: LysR family transcriptional activator of nhaA [Paraglaciecola sp.]|jgi:LysR family transcriptional activator of nhaA